MKSTKLTKTLIALFLAASMAFTLTACNDDPTDGPGTTSGTVTSDSSAPTENNTPNLTRQDYIEFGTMRFTSSEHTMGPGMAPNVGGNMGHTGGGIIRPTGFQGDAHRNWSCEDDPDSQWTTLVSQNGPFWENISRIEATFYLTSETGDAVDLTSVELWAIPGGMMDFSWWQGEDNLVSQFDAEVTDDEGFVWGPSCAMTAVWDIEKIAEERGRTLHNIHNPNRDYVFDAAPRNIGTDEEPEYIGGGINSFGMQIKNDNSLDDLTITINWTDVVIYVHDLELYNEHLAEVLEITGKEVSANTNGRVRQVA
jgi:hypothetical protein